MMFGFDASRAAPATTAPGTTSNKPTPAAIIRP